MLLYINIVVNVTVKLHVPNPATESTSSIATGPKEANRKDSCDTKKSIIFSQRPSIS